MFFTEGTVYPCILDRSSYVVCRYGIIVDKSTTIRSATIWNNGMDVKNRHEWGCPDLNRVSLGKPEMNEKFIKIMKEILS